MDKCTVVVKSIVLFNSHFHLLLYSHYFLS